MKVRITGIYIPEDDEADPKHEIGLTADAYERLLNKLSDVGVEVEEVIKVASS